MLEPFGGVFAHYGGIDEIGVFVVPAVAVIWFLRRAEKRAKGAEDESSDDSAVDTDRPPPLSSQPDE